MEDWDWNFISDVIKACVIALNLGIGGWILQKIYSIWKTLKEYVKTQNTTRKALMEIIRNIIVEEFEISNKNGYINNLKFELTDRLYRSYKELGGNGYITDMYERMRDMERKF